MNVIDVRGVQSCIMKCKVFIYTLLYDNRFGITAYINMANISSRNIIMYFFLNLLIIFRILFVIQGSIMPE